MKRKKTVVELIKIAEIEVNQLQEEINIEKKQEENIIDFVPKVKDVLAVYNLTGDIESKNRLLKSVIERVTYLRKKEWKKKDEFVVQLFPKV